MDSTDRGVLGGTNPGGVAAIGRGVELELSDLAIPMIPFLQFRHSAISTLANFPRFMIGLHSRHLATFGMLARLIASVHGTTRKKCRP